MSGIGASVSSLMIHENTVSVGASGAILGLFGVLLPILGEMGGKSLNISVNKLTFNCSLVLLYSISAGLKKPEIDNAAHIGGLFSGVMIGLFYLLIMNHKTKPIPILIMIAVIFGLFSTIIMTNVSDEIGDYERAMKKDLQAYQINDSHTIFYNLSMPVEDVKIVGDAVKRLKGYFPVNRHIDIIFLNNDNHYSIKLFVSKDLWQESAVIDRLKNTVDYIKNSGINKPINLILIDNQSHEEKQIQN